MESIDWGRVSTWFLAFLLSLTVHEAAHALVAKWRGDDTAEQEGRLTLNPVPHIDPFGTILMPILGVLFGGVIAWAKPVPVNSMNFQKPGLDDSLVAAAGPLSNLLLCAICVALLRLVQVNVGESFDQQSFFYPLLELLRTMVWVNALLAIFNLIPLPPLDGGAIFINLLFGHTRYLQYSQYVAPYGILLLFVVSYSGGFRWIVPTASYCVSVFQTVFSFII